MKLDLGYAMKFLSQIMENAFQETTWWKVLGGGMVNPTYFS